MENSHRQRILRRFGRRRGQRTVTASRSQPPVALARILALPIVDRLLQRMLQHPRVIQWIGALAGLVMIALALRPLFFLVTGAGTNMTPSIVAASTTPALVSSLDRVTNQTATGAPEVEILSVVAAYNQASITAAVLGRADVMAPYLAPGGTAWAEVQAEYQRRATRGEMHEPALTRWGALRIAIKDDTATVETQEQWDDITSISGEIVSSRRGLLTRNTYEMQRAPGLSRWLITTITTTTVIE